MNKTVKIIIQLVLLTLVVLLAYFLVKGIQKPIDFEEKRKARFESVINRLKDIRTAQVEFKKAHGSYTPHFDTLIDFVRNESMPVVRKEGFVPDTLTVKKAVELGIVKRDTVFIPYTDTLFGNKNYPLDSLKYIPCGSKAKFKMDTASVMTGSKVKVKVFEARINNWDILDGLDEQHIVNYNADKGYRSSLTVRVQDEYVLESVSMRDGHGPVTYDFKAKTGDTIKILYTEGTWPYENFIKVVDGEDNILADSVYLQEGMDGNWVGIANCGDKEEECTHKVKLFDKGGDGWSGGLYVGSLKEATNNAGNWE